MPLDQVFLYVTQKCNVRCVTCYALDQLERSRDLSAEELVELLRAFRSEGAWKLSVLGGEPTVHPRLTEITSAAHDIGFRFVRINTNGMFTTAWLDAPATRSIDVLCFSIDGATPAVNDAIRRGTRLDRIVANMRRAAAIGFDVRANMTVTAMNIDQVFDVMWLVQDCGATEINVNVMFNVGYAVDRPDLAVPPRRWLDVYHEVVRRKSEFSIRIKVPPAFAPPSDLPAHRADGHRCIAMDASRRYVASNGDVFPCLTMMDDPAWRVARFAGGELAAEPPHATPEAPDTHDYCHFIKLRSDGLRPLCIFHKSRLNG